MPLSSLPPFYKMIVTDKNDSMSADLYMYLDQQFQTLNQLLLLISQLTTTTVSAPNGANNQVVIDGLTIPSKSSADIANLVSSNSVPVGTIWYDTTLNKLKFLTNTGLETITSTP